MAILSYTREPYPTDNDGEHYPQETIEVRSWGSVGTERQPFYIGSGVNFNARDNHWLEVIYSVNGVPAFTTRSFLHQHWTPTSRRDCHRGLKDFEAGKRDFFGFGDMLPETGILLKRSRSTFDDQEYVSYELEISLDMGAVLGMRGPGQRMITISLPDSELEDNLAFLRSLIDELDAAWRGRMPSPLDLASSFTEWEFARHTNLIAYNFIAFEYQERYFENPLLVRMIDRWRRKLPAGGRVLDAGCGHGDPMIGKLLEWGFNVTGADLSPVMLSKAAEKYPQAEFANLALTELDYEAEFDAACSLSSLLYMDPIDLANALYRLRQALKPGGLLLYAYDSAPGFRMSPYHYSMNHWVWEWTYSQQEAIRALKAHGFKIVAAEEVTELAEKAERYQRMLDEHQKSIEAITRSLSEQQPSPDDAIKDAIEPAEAEDELPFMPPMPDFTPKESDVAYCYAIIARRTP